MIFLAAWRSDQVVGETESQKNPGDFDFDLLSWPDDQVVGLQ